MGIFGHNFEENALFSIENGAEFRHRRDPKKTLNHVTNCYVQLKMTDQVMNYQSNVEQNVMEHGQRFISKQSINKRIKVNVHITIYIYNLN